MRMASEINEDSDEESNKQMTAVIDERRKKVFNLQILICDDYLQTNTDTISLVPFFNRQRPTEINVKRKVLIGKLIDKVR